jgi:hypothetical protein
MLNSNKRYKIIFSVIIVTVFVVGIFLLNGLKSQKKGVRAVDSIEKEYVGKGKSVIIPNNALVTVSSSKEDDGFGKKFLVDGVKDNNTEARGWSSDDKLNENHTEWVIIDMKRIQYIDRIDIYPRMDDGYKGEFFPVDFNIQLSLDNTEWTKIVERQNYEKPDSVKSFRIATQTARYIKIEATKLREGGSDNKEFRMQLSEVEAYYDKYVSMGTIKSKSGKSYYVSSSTGDDNNNGLSPERPWKTLRRASEMIYNPGNKILLKSGDTWESETLAPFGQGTSEKPIEISSYGEGKKPKIKAGLGVGHGIKIVNSSGYKITNIEFANSVSGIMAVADQVTDVDYLWIENCEFYDITGPSIDPRLIMPYPEIYFPSGIVIACFGNESTSGKTYYKNITILNCNFDSCDTGIINTFRDTPMASDGSPTIMHRQFSRNSLEKVTIKDVKIVRSNRSGGIMLYGVKDGVIDNAFIDETGHKYGMYWGVAACQISMCEDVIVKNSEFTRTRRVNNSPDGEGFDFESGNKNVTLYNSYIHNNEGPGIMFYGENEGWRGFNENCVVDSCIIENNGKEGLFDHSKVFKNYSSNTGIIKNSKIKLAFKGQFFRADPVIFDDSNSVFDPDGTQIFGPGTEDASKYNLALGATVTASSTLEERGYSLKFINDGERSSMRPQHFGWSSEGNLSSNHEEWVVFDLGSNKEFNEIHVYAFDSWPSWTNPGMGLHYPKDLKILTSTDGQNWKVVVEDSYIPRPEKSLHRYQLPSRENTRYIKILGTNLRSNFEENNRYRMQLAEVEIYNK